MAVPLTTQSSWLAFTGQLEYYRSGKAGTLRNGGDVRQVNGFDIDVTGTASKLMVPTTFTPGPGIKTVSGGNSANLLDSGTLAASIQLQSEIGSAADWKAAAKSGADASAYVTSVGEVTELAYTPVGAEPQSVEGLGYFPGDVVRNGGQIDYVKSQVERDAALARTEAQLSAEYGVEVKLAFDPLAGEYMMLRPGQAGYDQVTSARDVFDRVMREDLGRMGNSDAFADILAKYGHSR